MPPQAHFARNLVRTVDRLMIWSTCTICGAASLVSDHDGTLAEWEEGHICKNGQSESRLQGDQNDDES